MLRLTSFGALPVSIQELRRHARVDHSEEDDVLWTYLTSAVEQVERTSGVGFTGSTWQWTGSSFPTGEINLGMAPLSSVVVTYTDEDNASQTLASSDYIVSGSCLSAVDAWPETADGTTVQVSFVSGDGTCPPPIQKAILMTALSAYEDRQTGGELTGPAQNMVGMYRRVWF